MWEPACFARRLTTIAAGRVPERARPLGCARRCADAPAGAAPAGAPTFVASTRKRVMKRYLLASDFDQTLSFNDSGIVLSDLLGISGFREKSAGLSRIHLVQQGAELAYLLLHDPEYRRVRKEHLIEVGKRIRLKQNLHLLPRLLSQLDGFDVAFYVISAAPQEVIQSALD